MSQTSTRVAHTCRRLACVRFLSYTPCHSERSEESRSVLSLAIGRCHSTQGRGCTGIECARSAGDDGNAVRLHRGSSHKECRGPCSVSSSSNRLKNRARFLAALGMTPPEVFQQRARPSGRAPTWLRCGRESSEGPTTRWCSPECRRAGPRSAGGRRRRVPSGRCGRSPALSSPYRPP